jgi:hypothetical protein
VGAALSKINLRLTPSRQSARLRATQLSPILT